MGDVVKSECRRCRFDGVRLPADFLGLVDLERHIHDAAVGVFHEYFDHGLDAVGLDLADQGSQRLVWGCLRGCLRGGSLSNNTTFAWTKASFCSPEPVAGGRDPPAVLDLRRVVR